MAYVGMLCVNPPDVVVRDKELPVAGSKLLKS
jgi:hypothetical protein